jgi:hypothetical protein
LPTLSDGDDRDADQEEGQIQGPDRQEDDGRHTGPFGASETCRFTIRLEPTCRARLLDAAVDRPPEMCLKVELDGGDQSQA